MDLRAIIELAVKIEADYKTIQNLLEIEGKSNIKSSKRVQADTTGNEQPAAKKPKQLTQQSNEPKNSQPQQKQGKGKKGQSGRKKQQPNQGVAETFRTSDLSRFKMASVARSTRANKAAVLTDNIVTYATSVDKQF